MIGALTAIFAATVLGLFALSGSLATTAAIMLMWLIAGLAIGLLMARSR